MAADVVELTRELVRTDTINPPGNEARAAQRLAARLEAAGFEDVRIGIRPGRFRFSARRPQASGPA